MSLRRVAEVLRRSARRDDLQRLAAMVTAVVALGNMDMHTKNIGLLHSADGRVSLAPAYDFIPQAHMPNDGRLALAVNGKYRLAEITAEDLLAEFASWQQRRPEPTVTATLRGSRLLWDQSSP